MSCGCGLRGGVPSEQQSGIVPVVLVTVATGIVLGMFASLFWIRPGSEGSFSKRA